MSVLKQFERVYDPDNNVTHICPYPSADAVTLCGQTDWIGNVHKPKYSAASDVDCQPCNDIVAYIKAGRI